MKLFISHFPTENFSSCLKDVSHVDFSLFVDQRPKTQEDLSPINFFLLQEPNEYFGHHDWVIQNKNLFSCIFTWSDRVLVNCENSMFLQFGSSWITDEIANEPREKIFSVGHLCGELLLTYGHQIRHEILRREVEIKIPKKFLFKGDRKLPAAIVEKSSIFGQPMFAAVIENTCYNGYFTEKITDCMMLKTVPIYWGCSDIYKFYNKDGIITFKSADDFIRICNNLTPDDYFSRLAAIEENFKRVDNHQNYEKRVSDEIVKILKYNNI